MFRDAVIDILAVVAKQEHARLSERVVASLRRAQREGKVLGRPKAIVDRQKDYARQWSFHPRNRCQGWSLEVFGRQYLEQLTFRPLLTRNSMSSERRLPS